MPTYTLPGSSGAFRRYAAPLKISPVDPNDLAGADLALDKDGLRVSPSGDYQIIDGPRAGAQSVRREAVASRKSFVRRPDWGMGIAETLFRSVGQQQIDVAIANIRTRLAANPRVTRTREVSAVAIEDGTIYTIRYDVAGHEQTTEIKR